MVEKGPKSIINIELMENVLRGVKPSMDIYAGEQKYHLERGDNLLVLARELEMLTVEKVAKHLREIPHAEDGQVYGETEDGVIKGKVDGNGFRIRYYPDYESAESGANIVHEVDGVTESTQDGWWIEKNTISCYIKKKVDWETGTWVWLNYQATL